MLFNILLIDLLLMSDFTEWTEIYENHHQYTFFYFKKCICIAIIVPTLNLSKKILFKSIHNWPQSSNKRIKLAKLKAVKKPSKKFMKNKNILSLIVAMIHPGHVSYQTQNQILKTPTNCDDTVIHRNKISQKFKW